MTDLPDDITQRLPEGDRIRERIRERREEQDASDDDAETAGSLKVGDDLGVRKLDEVETLGARKNIGLDDAIDSYTENDGKGNGLDDADSYLKIQDIEGESAVTTDDAPGMKLGTEADLKVVDHKADDIKLVDDVKTADLKVNDDHKLDDIKLVDDHKLDDIKSVDDHKLDDFGSGGDLKVVDEHKLETPDAEGFQTMSNVSKLDAAGEPTGLKWNDITLKDAEPDADAVKGSMVNINVVEEPADPVGDALAPLESPADETFVVEDPPDLAPDPIDDAVDGI